MASEEEIADPSRLDASRMDHRTPSRRQQCRNQTRPSPTIEGYGQGARNRSRNREPYAAGIRPGRPKPARGNARLAEDRSPTSSAVDRGDRNASFSSP